MLLRNGNHYFRGSFGSWWNGIGNSNYKGRMYLVKKAEFLTVDF